MPRGARAARHRGVHARGDLGEPRDRRRHLDSSPVSRQMPAPTLARDRHEQGGTAVIPNDSGPDAELARELAQLGHEHPMSPTFTDRVMLDLGRRGLVRRVAGRVATRWWAAAAAVVIFAAG